MQLEEARPSDVKDIRRIAASAFPGYDEYAALLPRFFESRGVTTYLAREGKETLGFVMLGFLPWSGGHSEGPRWIADILAIAVAAGHRRCGIGKALMLRAEELIAEMKEWRELERIELTCAAENQAALNFFASLGFEIVDPHHGNYATGQRAVRMAKPLSRSS